MCGDRNPRNRGMVCSLEEGHSCMHRFGSGGEWPIVPEGTARRYEAWNEKRREALEHMEREERWEELMDP